MRSEVLDLLDLLAKSCAASFDAASMLSKFGYKVEVIITDQKLDVVRLEKIK